MKKILLDREGDTICPEGYLRIETEVDFLVNALSRQGLLICGGRLCDWATIFYNGRRIEYSEITTLVRNLQLRYPDLTKDQAQFIGEMIGDNFVISLDNFNLQDFLNEIFPHNIWFGQPSKNHAAEWLLWLDDKEPDPAFHSIFAGISNNWKNSCPDLSIVYEANNTEKAREILKQWLGLENLALPNKIGLFPLSVPDKWKNLASSTWRKEMTKSDGQYLKKLMNTKLPRELLKTAAIDALDYFESNPAHLDKELHNYIARFVSGKNLERLVLIAQVIEPGNVPNDPESVFRWYDKEYSPYREWQFASQNKQAKLRAIELGKEFAKWYLDYYPIALNSKKTH